MKRKGICLLLALVLLLSAMPGCAAGTNDTGDTTQTTTAATEPPATVPADGDPEDVTCKGTYTTDTPDLAAVVAKVGGEKLTNGQLQAAYWLEVAAYQASGADNAPDFDRPLDSQVCPIDSSVRSWQQYFLKRALTTWHTAQALALQSQEVGLPMEEAYQPNLDNHAKYMTDMPATQVLYGYENNYHMNTLHETYLEEMPQLLEQLAEEKGFDSADALAESLLGTTGKDLLSWAQLYNTGYAYFTGLSYYVALTEEDVTGWMAEHPGQYPEDGERYVDLRQILVIPEVPEPERDPWNPNIEPTEPENPEVITVAEDGRVTASEAMWELAGETAREMLAEYEKKYRASQARDNKSTADAVFADYAHSQSDDTDTAPDGGLYYHLRRGQLGDEMDDWAFDEARQPGDTAIFRSECGWHILFFKGSTPCSYEAAQEDLTVQRQTQALLDAREAYPMTVSYDKITLTQTTQVGGLTYDELLYSDVAHQRYPEIPLYLQQDYPKTMYGNYKITSHGCGITTMAMVATYLADTELTPPMLCARYGGYCYLSGTDGSLFTVTPSEMGFYLKERTFDWRPALEAMKEGHVVTCVQTKGYWTRGGHYLALEKLLDPLEGEEDIRVQVRDSNIFNYGKLKDHKIDSFKWTTIPPNATSYWIYEYKIVNIAHCQRCGDPSGTTQTLLSGEYLCEKCQPALLRRDTYLTACGS